MLPHPFTGDAMSYFIMMRGSFGRKPIGHTLYSTKCEAQEYADFLNLTQYGIFEVGDADHEPTKSILRNRTWSYTDE